MIFTKSTCSSQTSSILFPLLLLLILGSCKEPAIQEIYGDFFPVETEQSDTPTNRHFGQEPILLRLEAYQVFNDNNSTVSTLLEKINTSTLLLYSDRDLYFNQDTLTAGTNLFPTDLVSFKTIQANGANGSYNSHYLLTLNGIGDSSFYNNHGSFLLNLNVQTQNGYSLAEDCIIILD